mgnify:CR=1 FL=1
MYPKLHDEYKINMEYLATLLHMVKITDSITSEVKKSFAKSTIERYIEIE